MESDLASLIARLEKAKEGSRELDARVAEHFSEWENLGGWWRRHKVTGAQERYSYVPDPPYTTDLSAAVALCERALPGWHWSIRKKSTNQDFFEGLVTQAAWSYAADRFKASHDCAPLALCLAILRAKASAHD